MSGGYLSGGYLSGGICPRITAFMSITPSPAMICLVHPDDITMKSFLEGTNKKTGFFKHGALPF